MEMVSIVVQCRWAKKGGWFDIRKCETMGEAEQSCEHAIDQHNAGLRAFGVLERGSINFRMITRRTVVTEAVLKEVEVTK